MAPIFAKQPDDNAPPAPPIAAPVFANPQMPDDAQAYPNEGGPGDMVVKAIHSLFTLPQRAIQNSQNSLDTGTYDPGPTLEAATLPMGTGAIAGVPVRAGEAVLGAGPIRAYHGSPHDFDAFDLSKIGTGEGAQAYGHGLYFAENPKVAEEYRNTLADWKIDGGTPNPSDPSHIAAVTMKAFNGNASHAIDDLTRTATVGPEAERGAAAQAIQMIQQGHKLPEATGGHMYEVNINADPEHFLDWDKPLSEQPKIMSKLPNDVRDRLRAVGEKNKGDWGDLGSGAPDEYTTGQHLITQLAAKKNAGYTEYNYPAATDALREAGIPGIKYLDQGSRAAGDGSRNYVVFDHNLIDIARKYGLAGAAIPPAIAPLFARGNQGQGS